jgi:glycosyltransferase involved in cell wall biosynthesis
MAQAINVLVVIPAYNEEKQIGRVIRGLFENGHTNIVVVDDGSTDETAPVAKAAGAVVLQHEVNRGQGAALETGNEYARRINSDFVVHFDADGQFNPADISAALRFMQENHLDVLFGSRFMDQRSKIPFIKKRLVLPVARWINFVFTGCFLTDAHNGFRILNLNALRNIKITQDRMAHNTEILQEVRRHGLKYAEFPVEVSYREYGQSALQGAKIVSDLLVGLFTK